MTQLLDDERIARMRSAVMTTVAEDRRRRARTTRSRLVLAGGVAALVMVGGIGAALNGGFPGGQTTSSDSSAAQSSADSSSADSAGGAVALAPAQVPAQASAQASRSASGADADRDVVVTGSASVTVSDVRATSDSLAAWVEAKGGRVDSRQYDAGNTHAHASLTLRVPASQVTATLDQLETYGAVSETEIDKEDVTGSARDLDARIKALRISISRLEGILDRAAVMSDVIRTESALTDRQAQLEQLVTQRARISEQVALATIDVTISPRERAESVQPGGFHGGLRDGWNALVTVVNHTVALAGVLLPWLALLALLYAVLRGARSLGRRWGAAR
ncbi:DUF4349 domain-containing protein [Nocardioides sp. Kera G14]|uniref:DUF4349 domain-containing protein n=1 Tax=Nocardioides sp. Kera G14 TaxID=2884264 RepID=UPI001D111356|nr:DUF4349 domain-containing protein [Nocardioides sp. Kera G14]UDY25065.1 DUF4349 domain-containing protein [Nocardioides sp. Kera G14]